MSILLRENIVVESAGKALAVGLVVCVLAAAYGCRGGETRAVVNPVDIVAQLWTPSSATFTSPPAAHTGGGGDVAFSLEDANPDELAMMFVNHYRNAGWEQRQPSRPNELPFYVWMGLPGAEAILSDQKAPPAFRKYTRVWRGEWGDGKGNVVATTLQTVQFADNSKRPAIGYSTYTPASNK
jgi:hypothetical protein